MRLAALFSGGKDSCYALHLARRQGHEIVCLLTVISENPESFMFHTPNIEWTRLQAEAMGLPLLTAHTKGEKESEVNELAALVRRAKEEFAIEGVVSGAIESVYQASRIQQVCAGLKLWCFNPLWKREQLQYLHDLHAEGFEVMVVGVFAEPFDERWLGRKIDAKAIRELEQLSLRYGIQPSGEGGEIETFVLHAPGWEHRLEVKASTVRFGGNAGTLEITELRRAGR